MIPELYRLYTSISIIFAIHKDDAICPLTSCQVISSRFGNCGLAAISNTNTVIEIIPKMRILVARG
jgi:hypothetical protein